MLPILLARVHVSNWIQKNNNYKRMLLNSIDFANTHTYTKNDICTQITNASAFKGIESIYTYTYVGLN